ncbi:hypothetical protein BFX80_08115 [Cobetia marina]|nr:hypothetical protein BFX80_08115 [Cobetia marina]
MPLAASAMRMTSPGAALNLIKDHRNLHSVMTLVRKERHENQRDRQGSHWRTEPYGALKGRV